MRYVDPACLSLVLHLFAKASKTGDSKLIFSKKMLVALPDFKSMSTEHDDVRRMLEQNRIKSCDWFTLAIHINAIDEVERLNSEGIILVDESGEKRFRGKTLTMISDHAHPNPVHHIMQLERQIKELKEKIKRLETGQQTRYDTLFNSKTIIPIP